MTGLGQEGTGRQTIENVPPLVSLRIEEHREDGEYLLTQKNHQAQRNAAIPSPSTMGVQLGKRKRESAFRSVHIPYSCRSWSGSNGVSWTTSKSWTSLANRMRRKRGVVIPTRPHRRCTKTLVYLMAS